MAKTGIKQPAIEAAQDKTELQHPPNRRRSAKSNATETEAGDKRWLSMHCLRSHLLSIVFSRFIILGCTRMHCVWGLNCV